MKVLRKLLNTHFLSHQMLEEDCFLLLEFHQEKNLKFFLSPIGKGEGNFVEYCNRGGRDVMSEPRYPDITNSFDSN